MYDINADFFMVPTYRISPFNTSYIYTNSEIAKSTKNADFSLYSRFCDAYQATITSGGREAISLALEDAGLKKNDLVTIITPSQNTYVSSCVTKSIGNYCRWNRELNKETTVVFIVHEFGKLFNAWECLKSFDGIVIEDFAHAFLSTPECKNKADYYIFSFPKSFPIQYGGALLCNKIISSKLKQEECSYINSVVGWHYKNITEKIKKQKENYDYLSGRFLKKGIETYGKYEENEVPTVFMLDTSNLRIKNYNECKEKIQNKGIECSVFYGKEAFFIPVNYNLNMIDLDYIFDCVYSVFEVENDS